MRTMRTYVTRTVPATTRQEIASVKCDICGRAAKDAENWSGESRYDIDGTTVEMKVTRDKGTSFPDGGQRTSTRFDICPQCFEQVLVPFLESKGAKPTVDEVDW